MSYILHIDTSADTSSIAISHEGQIIALETNAETRNHATAINNMIAAAVEKAGLRMQQLMAVAVCSGPGSYTGLRIAMATAKGICYAMDIPLMLNDKLWLLAMADQERYNDACVFAAILIAREKEYFMGVYTNKGDVLTNSGHFFEAEMGEILKFQEKLHITTNAAEELFYKLKVSFLSVNQDITPDFHYWGKIAFLQYKQRQFSNILYAAPNYLKQVYTHK